MKKQWLSIVLVLCMVLCMAPTTARAAEGETCELKITVESCKQKSIAEMKKVPQNLHS